MTYAPTFRYAVGIHGANYASADHGTPGDWYMTETIDAARELIRYLARDMPHLAEAYGEPADGTVDIFNTPLYGEPGDGAMIYFVNREHPDFSEVLDEPGDRARHAFGFIEFDYPAYVATFGKRGGLTIERAS